MKAFIYGYGSIGRRHHATLLEIDKNLSVEINDPIHGFNSEPFGHYDIGLICTSTNSHLECAKKLKEKCNILFIEKPLHSSIEEIKKFNMNNVHVGCNIRYTDAISSLKEISKDAYMVRITAMSNLLNWRKDPKKLAYSFHQSLGGGVLLDFIHEPDFAYYCFGLPDNVKIVEKRLTKITVDSTDSCMMIWEYSDKLISFCLSYGSEEYIRKVEVTKKDLSSFNIKIEKEDIEKSYKKQWLDILNNGSQNSYSSCRKLYEKILGAQT